MKKDTPALRTGLPTSTVKVQRGGVEGIYLEALVLKHFLDGGILTVANQLCLKDDAERSISDNFAVCIGELVRFSGLALVGHNLDYL